MLLNAGLPTINRVRVKHLYLYEDLGLHHSPKEFLQQTRTLNLSLLSPSQPSSYNPATYFEACICAEVSMQLKTNLYLDYCKMCLELHTSEINFLPYLSLTAAVWLSRPIFRHQLNSQPFPTYCHQTLTLRLFRPPNHYIETLSCQPLKAIEQAYVTRD